LEIKNYLSFFEFFVNKKFVNLQILKTYKNLRNANQDEQTTLEGVLNNREELQGLVSSCTS